MASPFGNFFRTMVINPNQIIPPRFGIISDGSFFFYNSKRVFLYDNFVLSHVSLHLENYTISFILIEAASDNVCGKDDAQRQNIHESLVQFVPCQGLPR